MSAPKAPHLRGVIDTEGSAADGQAPAQAPKTTHSRKDDIAEGTDVPDTWPKRNEVARLIGMTADTVRNYEIRGKLTPVKDRQGMVRFQPEEVEALLIDLGIDSDRTEQWKQKAYARADMYSALQAFSLVAGNVRALATASERQDKRADAYMNRLEAENERLRARIETLEKREEASRDEKQKVHSQNVDDQAIAAIVESEKARDDRIVRILGSLADNVQGFLTAGEEPSTDHNPTAFLNTLDLDKLEALADRMGDMLTPEHLAAIQRAHARKIQAAQAKAEAAPQSEAKPNASG